MNYLEHIEDMEDCSTKSILKEFVEGHEEFCYPESFITRWCIANYKDYIAYMSSLGLSEFSSWNRGIAYCLLKDLHNYGFQEQYPNVIENLKEELEYLSEWKMSQEVRRKLEGDLDYFIRRFSRPRGIYMEDVRMDYEVRDDIPEWCRNRHSPWREGNHPMVNMRIQEQEIYVHQPLEAA